MNVDNIYIKKTASDLKRWSYSKLEKLGITDVGYGYLNTKQSYAQILPSNYDWFLYYYEQDLDLKAHSRLANSRQCWDTIEPSLQQALSYKCNGTYKLDISLYYDGIFEILSVHSKKPTHTIDNKHLYKTLHFLSHESSKIRNSKQGDKYLLPLRDEKLTGIYRKTSKPILSLDIKDDRYLDGIKFHSIEIEIIRHLLSMKTAKEIAVVFRCSEQLIRKRVFDIKQKLGNAHMHPQEMFRLLKKHTSTSLYSSSS